MTVQLINIVLKPLADAEQAESVAVYGADSIVGRAADCDLQIKRPMISRHHCRLSADSDIVYVEDLGSRNGTAVNMQVVRGKCLLNDGDELWLADNGFKVRICKPAASEILARETFKRRLPSCHVRIRKPRKRKETLDQRGQATDGPADGRRWTAPTRPSSASSCYSY